MSDLKIKGPGLGADPSAAGLPGRIGTSPAGAVGGSGAASPFTETLKQAERFRIDGELKEILGNVRAVGERFLRAPDEWKLNTYKDSIKRYLRRISKELFALRQEAGSPKDGQQKIYQLVETIDAEIDSLTRDTLQKDKALALLASLDEIRGLVLDLIV